jgi:hypothetical protein
VPRSLATGATRISNIISTISNRARDGTYDRPDRTPNLCCRWPQVGHLLFGEFDMVLEVDSIAINVLELPEGVFGDVDGILDVVEKVDQ